MRTMYDAVTPSRIPSGATMVAGYADGHYANLTALRKRFPHATVVTIAVSSHTRAQVLDVEPGDATAASAVTWCTHTMADTPNTHLTIYCNSSTLPKVKAAFHAAGVSLPQFWVADWDGRAEVPSGCVAKQYRSTAGYDVSAVADHWPGVDSDLPKVSLAAVVFGATHPEAEEKRRPSYADDVRHVQDALAAKGLLKKGHTAGIFDVPTKNAYSAWQKQYSKAHGLGWKGADVNGVPGPTSLKALGSGRFTVTT